MVLRPRLIKFFSDTTNTTHTTPTPTPNTNMKNNQYLALREAKFALNESRLKELGSIIVSLLSLKSLQYLLKIKENQRKK